jgi:hypothetical protein
MSGFQSKKKMAVDRIVSVWEQNEFKLFTDQVKLYQAVGMSVPSIAQTLNTSESVIQKIISHQGDFS